MAQKLTLQDGQEAMIAHATAKGQEIRSLYGPKITAEVLSEILRNETCTRYPTRLVFDSVGIPEGTFGAASLVGKDPEEGYRLFIHPHFQNRPEALPALVLYQLVTVNYGDFATAETAEAFASAALGMNREDYYTLVCRLADEVLEK